MIVVSNLHLFHFLHQTKVAKEETFPQDLVVLPRTHALKEREIVRLTMTVPETWSVEIITVNSLVLSSTRKMIVVSNQRLFHFLHQTKVAEEETFPLDLVVLPRTHPLKEREIVRLTMTVPETWSVEIMTVPET